MVEQKVTVANNLGLHARAAAQLVRAAGRFQSKLRLERVDGSAIADAKSILSVLMLAASRGTELRAVAEGEDEVEAIKAVCNFFANDVDETEKDTTEAITQPREMRWRGLSVSEGLVVGRVLRIHDGTRHVYQAHIEETEIERELRRLRTAVRSARRQLSAIKAKTEKELGKEHAYIFDAHLLLLDDRKLISDIEGYITREHANAEWAVRVIGDRLLSVYADVSDAYLRGRGADIEDVIHRILIRLIGERPQYGHLSEDAVIVSEDLLPSTVAELDLEHVRAIAIDAGGWTSHTAIIARGLGIPAVVGLRDLYRRARTGDEIIVDSFTGEVILHPSMATSEAYRTKAVKASKRQTEPVAVGGSVRTLDGLEIRLRANVELPAEFEGVLRYGAQGIGLYRSEFLLARPGVMLSEEEQYLVYSEVARLAGLNGAIIRLFDLGGDKAGGRADAEPNPALGLRAIRFGLRYESVMRTQARAIMRAAAKGRLDIVLPMIADVSDVLRAKEITQSEQRKLEAEGIEFGPVRIGAMMEVPSAVLTAATIARVVDFFELGTNDLVQYLLAVDRGNEKVADWFRSLHPAVLQSIWRILDAAREVSIPAIVCGEMAATPAYAVLLVGLGAVDFSMAPSSIPRVRRALAQIDSGVACSIAARCLQCQTADEVEGLVRELFSSHWPHIFPPEKLPATPPAGS